MNIEQIHIDTWDRVFDFNIQVPSKFLFSIRRMHKDVMSFGQLHSKFFVADKIRELYTPKNIVTCAGWTGILAHLLFQCFDNVKITNIDSDYTLESHNCVLNSEYDFTFLPKNIIYEDYSPFDLVINTSMEHLSLDQYEQWFEQILTGTDVVLHSNTMSDLDDHVNCDDSLNLFVNKYSEYLMFEHCYEICYPTYTRFFGFGKRL